MSEQTSEVPSRDGVTHHPSPITRLVAVLASCLALAVVIWGFLQLDLPVARFLRSVHLEWLDLVGEAGNRLGSGWVLAGISATLLAAGWWLNRPSFRQAGLDGLLAHGAVALVVQTLKHLIGRPRPRMTHGTAFQFGPSWESGFDSFPSGHTAASFAVAVVLARHFPRMAWLCYGAAGVVAVSRVARGSHFPTDSLAGICLGVMVGAIIAGSFREWKASVSRALISLTPYLVGSLAVLWIAVHPSTDHRLDLLMVGAGIISMAIGMAGRLWRRMRPDKANAAIALGLALTTGSLFIIALAALTILGQRLAYRDETMPADSIPGSPDRSMLSEAALAAGLLLAVVVLQELKGILPIL